MQLYKTSIYTEEILEWSTILSNFTFSAGSMSSASCRSLDNTHVKLYSDSSCSTTWTDTSKIIFAEDVANEFRIKVIKDTGFVPTSVFVGETTLGLVEGCKNYTFEVCGVEIVSLKDSRSELSYTHNQYSGSFLITNDEIKEYF